MRAYLFVVVCLCLGFFTSPLVAQPDTLWTNVYGGYEFTWFGMSVSQTIDDGYVIAGKRDDNLNMQSDGFLIKVDALGYEEWRKIYGTPSSYESIYRVLQTDDSGYILVGGCNESYNCDICLIKTDSLGNEQWIQTFDYSELDEGYFIQRASDNGYIIVGYSMNWSTNNTDIVLVKTDAFGNLQWDQSFDQNDIDYGYCVQQTSDGGYCIIGSTQSHSGNSDVYLVKTNANGVDQWSRTFGGAGDDEGYSIRQTEDSGYIIAGYTISDGSQFKDVYLIRTDGAGNEIWSRTFGGPGDDQGKCIQQDPFDGYIVVGSTNSYGAGLFDVYLIKTDLEGNEIWTETLGGERSDQGEDIQQTTDGGYIIAGMSDSYGQYFPDAYLIRLESETGIIDPNIAHPLRYSVLSAYPNPFNPSTVISFDLPVAGLVELVVFDVNGRLVSGEQLGSLLQAGHHSITFDGTGLPSGIYFARLTAGNFQQTQKLVLMK